MGLKGVNITEGKIGFNVSGDSREFGLILNGIAVSGGVQLNTLYRLRRVSDAEAIGITETYDTTNKVRVYRHIFEFFRMAGDGKMLNLFLVGQKDGSDDITPSDMVEKAKEMVFVSGGLISDLAFGFNPASDYTDTPVNGMNSDIFNAISALQVFADWCSSNDMPLHVILEGRDMSNNMSLWTDLRNIQISNNQLSATKVTLVVGQDWDYAESIPSQDTIGRKYADVGTFLGCIAAQAWNRNPGEVESMNLTDTTNKLWLTGGFSNHTKYMDSMSILETLDEKGYCFPIRYTGVSGYWWNDGHVCAPIVVDKAGNMNQHTIYYSHTIDMCKRGLRIALLPEVKKPVPLEGGKLVSGMVDYYNKLGDSVFNSMASKGLISEGKTEVDPDSDMLVDKVLRVSFSVIPTGMVNEIVGTINLKNN